MEQAKAIPEGQPPPEWGRGAFETALRWLGVAAFVAFAAWSAWMFLGYSVPRAAGPFFPNSLRVKFTLADYLSTFGPWRGLGALPWGAWLLWIVWASVTWVAAFLLSPKMGGRPARPLLMATLAGALAMDFLVSAAWPWLYLHLGIPLPVLTIIAFLALASRRGPLGPSRVFARRSLLETSGWEDLARAWPRWRSTILVRVGVAFLLLVAFLATSTPPIQSDGLRYHLAAPEIWVREGRLISIEGMAFSHFPSLIEMWFVAALRHDLPVAAKLFHFLFFLISLGLLAAFTRRLAHWSGLPPRVRRLLPLLAVALAVTVPSFTIVSTWSFTDAGVVCFHLAALFALALWWHTGRMSHLILAGALAGFALGTKYTALVPVFVLGLGVLLHSRPALRGAHARLSGLQRLRNALVFGLIALALGSPWYIRNWVQTGNPVYPLANEEFNAPGWPPSSQALWEEKASQKGVGFDWPLMGKAWRGATFEWAGGPGVREGGFEDQSIGLTPWLLAPLGIAGLALIALRRGGWWWFYLVFVGSSYALWFRTYQSNRLLLTTLLIALPGAVVGLAWLTQRWRALWVATLIALSVAATYQGLWIARYFLVEEYPLQLALGFMDPDEWRALKLNYCDGTRAIRALVPEHERALVIGESRRFYFPPNVVMSDWYDPPAVLKYLERARTPWELTQALAADGVTHVFINHAELFPLWLQQPSLIRSDGTLDAQAYWQAWLRTAPAIPPESNLAHFRRRFTDAQAALLAEWLSTVPHVVAWHGETRETAGVELWKISS